jgi:WD40 repeat protein
MAFQWLTILLLLFLAACGATSPQTSPAQSSTEPLATTSATLLPPTAVPSPGPTESIVPPRPTTIPTPTPNPSLVSFVEVRDVGAVAPLAWSPDGSSLLVGIPGQQLLRYPLDGSPTVTLLDTPHPGVDYAQIRATWDDTTGAIITSRTEDDGTITVVALGPDGMELRRFVEGVASDNWWVSMERHLLAEANAKPLSIFDVAIASDGAVGVLGDTDVLLMRLGQPDVRVDLPTQVQAARNEASSDDYQSLWLAPKSGKLAVVIESHLYLFGPGQDDLLTIIEMPNPQGEPPSSRGLLPFDLSWSQDGTRLAVVGANVNEGMGRFRYESFVVDQGNGTLRRIDGGPTESILPLPYVTGNDRDVDGISWSPDGRWLLLGRGNEAQCSGGPFGCLSSQTVLDPEVPSVAMLWLAPGYGLVGVWSPDGRRIAVFCTDSEAYNPDTYHLCILTLAQGWESALQ